MPHGSAGGPMEPELSGSRNEAEMVSMRSCAGFSGSPASTSAGSEAISAQPRMTRLPLRQKPTSPANPNYVPLPMTIAAPSRTVKYEGLIERNGAINTVGADAAATSVPNGPSTRASAPAQPEQRTGGIGTRPPDGPGAAMTAAFWPQGARRELATQPAKWGSAGRLTELGAGPPFHL